MTYSDITRKPKKHTVAMNSATLLNYLKDGYRLHTRWSYGKCFHYISKPDTETIYIQKSNISALIKAGKLRSILLSGDNLDYYLTEEL